MDSEILYSNVFSLVRVTVRIPQGLTLTTDRSVSVRHWCIICCCCCDDAQAEGKAHGCVCTLLMGGFALWGMRARTPQTNPQIAL